MSGQIAGVRQLKYARNELGPSVGNTGGDSKACHGTAVLIHERWSKHIKEVDSGPRFAGVRIGEKFSLQLNSVYYPRTGYGDEVFSKLPKHTD